MAINSNESKPITERELSRLSVGNKNRPSLDSITKVAHKMMDKYTCDYLNRYGINGESIDRFRLGVVEVDGSRRLTVPIFNKDSEVAYIRLYSMLNGKTAEVMAKRMGEYAATTKSEVCPTGAKLLLVGEDDLAKSASSSVLICDDELSRVIAIQEGVKMPVVTSGDGARAFKDEWVDLLGGIRNIYICVNTTSEDGVKEFMRRLAERIPTASIYKISLPLDNDAHVSLINYFAEKRGTADELFSEYAEFCYGAKPIDASQFKELTVEDIARVLDLTIKHDFVSKVVTFLVMLLAYTESDQQNVMFNADSSTGKTYICLEVSKYFPQQDVKIYGKTTPTAFYYSPSLQEKNIKTGQSFINLERRILIFTEQPDTQLQENLRALLSHDSKCIPFAITNKSSGKNIATEGYILGFPSTFFCSANMRVDEQEQTRCLIISPENSQEKILAGINASIAKNSNNNVYKAQIENNAGRRQLMERIIYIKELNIEAIDIDDSEYLKSKFMENRDMLQPKAQREISHFISLVKAMALVNAPFRMKNGRLVATNRDTDEAMKLWTSLRESMSYGVSPQVLNFYKKYILPAYRANNEGAADKPKGVTYDEIRAEYYNRTGNYPNMENVRKQYIPALKTAALISCERDKEDRRQNLITPLEFFDSNMDN